MCRGMVDVSVYIMPRRGRDAVLCRLARTAGLGRLRTIGRPLCVRHIRRHKVHARVLHLPYTCNHRPLSPSIQAGDTSAPLDPQSITRITRVAFYPFESRWRLMTGESQPCVLEWQDAKPTPLKLHTCKSNRQAYNETLPDLICRPDAQGLQLKHRRRPVEPTSHSTCTACPEHVRQVNTDKHDCA
jgi:hypothetical protein